MSARFSEKQSTRREMLRNSAAFAGSALLASLFPASFLRAGVTGSRQQAASAPADRLSAMRAQMGAAPIQTQPLGENAVGVALGLNQCVAFRWRAPS